MSEVKRIGVVGGGQMGSGIAQVAAMHGIDVWLHDLDPQALSKAFASISSSINRFVSKNHVSQAAGADALKRLRLTTDLEDFQLADLIIEAIVESEDVKKSLFVKLCQEFCYFGVQHQLHFHHASSDFHQQATSGDRNAFYEPTACDEID